MAGIFISYRRDDSGGYAGRLFDLLAARFGADQTFMDLDDIKGGDDFTAVIGEKVGQCSALLAIIGERWLTIAGEDGVRRLDSQGDFVRLEIAKALERGVRVVPVLVGGATMPRREDLPASLAGLAVHQAVELRDAHFHADAAQLVDVLQSTVPGLGASVRRASWRGWLPAAAVAAVVVVAVTAGVILSRRPASNAAAPRPETPPAAAVAGRWTGTVKYDWGDSHAETFELEIAGQDVTGTASFLGYPRGILDGRLEGNRLTFSTKSITSLNDKSYEDTHLYRGTIDGGTISFTMMTDSAAESHVPVRFTAQRAEEQKRP